MGGGGTHDAGAAFQRVGRGRQPGRAVCGLPSISSPCGMTGLGPCRSLGSDCPRSPPVCRVVRWDGRCYTPASRGIFDCRQTVPFDNQLRTHVARTARTWKGARTPSALKRVRQALRRRQVNRRTRSEAKTLVQRASEIALGRTEGDGPEAVTAAISALDKAAEKGIIHPNNAARRKSRLMAKVNAAHLLDDVAATTTTTKKRTAASKTAQRKKVAAAKASKAAAGKAADRPRTAAGKAKVAVTRASRDAAAARRRTKSSEGDES